MNLALPYGAIRLGHDVSEQVRNRCGDGARVLLRSPQSVNPCALWDFYFVRADSWFQKLVVLEQRVQRRDCWHGQAHCLGALNRCNDLQLARTTLTTLGESSINNLFSLRVFHIARPCKLSSGGTSKMRALPCVVQLAQLSKR